MYNSRACSMKTPSTTHPKVADILAELRALGSEKNRAGMARYGINVVDAFGVSINQLRKVAKRLGTNHPLALALWATGNHEARLLACFVDDPASVSAEQLEAWARGFDSWDICDQATTSLFDLTKHGWDKARRWAGRDQEWVKRAGFALMAGLAVHDKSTGNRAFAKLLPVIQCGAFDERNFVKKAVNWALRNIGKRNRALNAAAIACAESIRSAANQRAGGERGGDPAARSARWVATDALRELRPPEFRRASRTDRSQLWSTRLSGHASRFGAFSWRPCAVAAAGGKAPSAFPTPTSTARAPPASTAYRCVPRIAPSRCAYARARAGRWGCRRQRWCRHQPTRRCRRPSRSFRADWQHDRHKVLPHGYVAA